MTMQAEPAGSDRPAFEPGDLLAQVDRATERFLATAERLDDAAVRGPSLLPGWTRGHVLAHVARNADGLVNLLGWGRTGVETPQYASAEARDADIEAGAGRSAADQLADLRDSAARFRAAVEAMPADRWDTTVTWRGGASRPVRAVLPARLREVEIHHVDLDVDYTPAHWHTDFSSYVLAGASAAMTESGAPAVWLHAVDTDRTWSLGPVAADSLRVSGPEVALLAWLIGRSSGDGLMVDPHGTPLPALPAWS